MIMVVGGVHVAVEERLARVAGVKSVDPKNNRHAHVLVKGIQHHFANSPANTTISDMMSLIGSPAWSISIYIKKDHDKLNTCNQFARALIATFSGIETVPLKNQRNWRLAFLLCH
jgi:hypothetical protein